MTAASSDLSKQLAGSDPAALELLGLLAFLAPEPLPAQVVLDHPEALPTALADSLGDDDRREPLLAGLAAESRIDVQHGLWTIGDEVRAALREDSDDEQRRRWCEAVLALMRAAFPEDADEVSRWEACEALLPHLLTAVEQAKQLDGHDAAVAWLLERAAFYLDAKGEPELARQLAKRAVEAASDARDAALGGAARRALGDALASLGDYAAAADELEDAVTVHDLDTDAGDGGGVEGARARASLALALLHQDRLEKARAVVERATEVLDHAGDEIDGERLEVWLARGWLLLQEDEPAAAKAEFDSAVQLAERTRGPEHLIVASALTGLGVAQLELGDSSAAVAAEHRALAIAEASVGPKHPRSGTIRSFLGEALLDAGRLREAREHVERALAIGESTLPEGHPSLRVRHRRLAEIARRQGDLETAQRQLEAALAIAERAAATADDPDVVADLTALAGIVEARDDRSAIELYQRVLALVEQAKVGDDAEIARHHMLVGRCAHKLREPGIAHRHYGRALQLHERDAGSGSVGAARCRMALGLIAKAMGGELAAVYATLGDEPRADEMRDATRSSYSDVLTRELSMDDGETLVAVALAAIDSGDLELAGQGLVKAQDALEARSGSGEVTPRAVATAWNRLGRAHRDRQELDAAEGAYQAAIPLLADDARVRGVVLHDLGDVRLEQRRTDEAIELYRQAVEHKRDAAARPRDVVASLAALTLALIAADRAEEAAAAAEQGVELLERAERPERRLLGRTLTLAGRARAVDGDFEAALEQLEAGRELLGDDGVRASERAPAVGLLAAVYEALDRSGDARTLLERELADMPAEAALVVGEATREIGALRLCELAVERAQEIVLGGGASLSAGVSPRHVGLAWHRLGRSHVQAAADGDDAARDHAWHAFERGLPLLASRPDEHGVVLHDLADLRRDENRLAEAVGLYQRAAERKREAVPATPDLAVTLMELGRALRKLGRFEEARTAFEQQLAELAARPERDPQGEGLALHALGNVWRDERRWEDAIGSYERALSRKREAGDRDLGSVALTLLELGRAYAAHEDLDQALATFAERMELLSELPEADPWDEGITLHDIADVRRAQDRGEEAADLYRQALERKRASDDANSLDITITLLALSVTEADLEHQQEAERHASEAIERLRARTGGGGEDERLLMASALTLAGGAQLALDRPSEALEVLEEADELMEPMGDSHPQEAASVKSLLAGACEALGRDVDADAAREQAKALTREDEPG